MQRPMQRPMQRRTQRKPARGFTLVEIAVVMTIMVTLATLALPYYGDYVARQRLKAAAEHLAADLAEARFESARRGTPIHVNFSAGADWCYAVTTAPGCACRAVAACRLKSVDSTGAGGISMPAGKEVLFSASGSSTPSAVRFQTLKGQALVVQTSALGRARICSPQGEMPGYARC